MAISVLVNPLIRSATSPSSDPSPAPEWIPGWSQRKSFRRARGYHHTPRVVFSVLLILGAALLGISIASPWWTLHSIVSGPSSPDVVTRSQSYLLEGYSGTCTDSDGWACYGNPYPGGPPAGPESVLLFRTLFDLVFKSYRSALRRSLFDRRSRIRPGFDHVDIRALGRARMEFRALAVLAYSILRAYRGLHGSRCPTLGCRGTADGFESGLGGRWRYYRSIELLGFRPRYQPNRTDVLGSSGRLVLGACCGWMLPGGLY